VIPRPLYVTSPFGMREYPFGGRWMHNGVDLRSPCGQAQVAPGNGVVASVRPAAGNSTHGNQVFINLGNVNGHSWVAVTNHMSAFNVRPGQSVTQGQVIGWTGQTGQVTGCHVHMEVWRDGQVINPMSLPGF
jgi:putative M23 peptidase domain protein